jgi:hypothetical protein
VLELAAGSREAALGQGALNKACDIRVSLGVRLGATHGGGGSQPEERHGMAADVLKIDRRRKKHGTEGFRIINFRTLHLLRSGNSIIEFNQPLPESVPGYR